MQISRSVLKQLKKIAGEQNVLTDALSLSLYSYDCSLSRTKPDVVILVSEGKTLPVLIQFLVKHHIPFTPRAAATNHAGGCATLYGGAVLDLTRLNRILTINTQEKFADVQPGVITADLQDQASRLGLLYAPDPASARVCTLGGNAAQNASGARCMKYGGTADYILEADWISPTGETVHLTRGNPGPDWIGFLCGSEGTLGLFSQLRLKLIDEPKHIKTFLVTFSSLQEGIQTVTDLAAQGIIPRCVEAMDNYTTKTVEEFSHAGYPTGAQALLILELDGTPKQIETEAARLEEICRKNSCQTFTAARTEAERAKLWLGRRAAYAATTLTAPNVMVGDGTVPRSQLPLALQKVNEIISRYGLTAGLLFHAGDGNFHPHLVFDERNRLQASLAAKAAKEILQACVECGGTVSGEHGVGVEKRAAMAFEYDKHTLGFFSSLKNALDPQHLSNPGKIIPVDFAEKCRPDTPLSPAEEQLAQEIKKRFNQNISSWVTGAGSRRKHTTSSPLNTRGLNKIIEVDKNNYTVTAQAGVSTAELAQRLEKEGVFSSLAADKGTLGGAFACNICPEFSRQVTGLKALLPTGQLVCYGGKIMKNAAGYNLCRLFAGSAGELGLITELTFKIYATPQNRQARKQAAQNSVWPKAFTAVKQAADPAFLFGQVKERETHE